MVKQTKKYRTNFFLLPFLFIARWQLCWYSGNQQWQLECWNKKRERLSETKVVTSFHAKSYAKMKFRHLRLWVWKDWICCLKKWRTKGRTSTECLLFSNHVQREWRVLNCSCQQKVRLLQQWRAFDGPTTRPNQAAWLWTAKKVFLLFQTNSRNVAPSQTISNEVKRAAWSGMHCASQPQAKNL